MINSSNLGKQISKLILGKFTASIFCLFLFFVQNSSAFAYYWGSGLGWGYYSLGSSLLWPVSYLLFPYVGYANPYNLSTSAYRLGYSGSQAFTSYLYSPYRYLPYNSAYNYNLGNNYNSPYSYYNSPASPTSTPSASTLPQRQPDPNDIFNPVPPVAPNRRQQTSYQETPIAQNAANPAVLTSFFQTVSTQYKGDLLKALQQPDIRSWAQSLGIIEPGQILPVIFPKTRKSEITAIIKDHSIDVYKKAELLKLLLK